MPAQPDADGTYRRHGPTPARGRLVPLVVGALLAADLALIAAYPILQLLGYRINLLALPAEQSLPNWYSTAKLLDLAQLLAVLAWVLPAPTRRARCVLLAPAALFLLLSLEETISIHERLVNELLVPLLGGSGRGGFWSLLLGLPLAAAMVAGGVAYGRLVRPSRSTLAKAAAGAAVFLAGAVGADILADFLAERTTARVLAATAEEGGELVGTTLLIWAALDLVAREWRSGGWAPRGG
jgi:hypothetical protein